MPKTCTNKRKVTKFFATNNLEDVKKSIQNQVRKINNLSPIEPTRRSGVSPGRGLLIPLGYLHPGKCEHSEVQSHPPLCNGRSTLDGFRRYVHARVQAESDWLRKRFCIPNTAKYFKKDNPMG